MIDFLFDPKVFNVAIICMFVLAAMRWAFFGNYSQATYFAAAAVLNIAVFPK